MILPVILFHEPSHRDLKENICINTQYLRNSIIVYQLNMEHGWNFWLKVSFSYVHPPQLFFWNSYTKHVIFIREFDNFGNNPCLYDIRNILKFLHAHGGMSKIFFLDNFSSSFLGQKWWNFPNIPFWLYKLKLNKSLVKELDLATCHICDSLDCGQSVGNIRFIAWFDLIKTLDIVF